MLRLTSALITALVMTLSSLAAQSVYVADTGTPGLIDPYYTPSPGYPNGGPGFTGPIGLPMASLLSSSFFPNGGIAIDQTTSRVFTTDGFSIATDYHNLYAPFVAPFPTPLPTPAPALLTGAPLTGLGADPMNGRLWATDGSSYAALMLGAPFNIIGVAVPLPFGLPVGVRLTGIDYDDATGSLWGVDYTGNVYNWMPFGAVIGLQPVSTVPSPVGMSGIAVNETNGAGALSAPFCSTQIPGYHVMVTDSLFIYDALNLANPPIPITATGSAAAGLAFSADQQYLAGVGLPPIAVGTPGWNKPQNNGIGGANVLRLVGAQPLTTTLFLYDFCPIPGGLFIPASGETLWLNPFSSTFNFATLITDSFGQISVPINLSFSLTGFTYTGQYALYSPTSPLGYALSDAMTFTIGRP